jgi:serine/threonine protein kinase
MAATSARRVGQWGVVGNKGKHMELSQLLSNSLIVANTVTMKWPAPGDFVTSPATGTVYRIGQRRGDGFFGIVFDATDCWGNELAIKVLRPERGTFDEIVNAASLEFKNLLTLRSPFITHVFDGFIHENACYIVTERCSATLAFIIEQPWFVGAHWTMPVAKSLLQAVHYIHDSGMVHKDIHLGNVMTSVPKTEIGNTNEPVIKFKVADLGICKIADDVNCKNTLLANFIKPPEALDPVQFGPIIPRRIDQYHAGLVLLQVHLGKVLSISQDDAMRGVPRQIAEQIPAPVGPAIARALRRHSIARYQSVRDFWLALSGNNVTW